MNVLGKKGEPTRTKTFEGKRYTFRTRHKRKSQLKKQAERLVENGAIKKYRIVEDKFGWAMYVRKTA